MEMLSTHGVIMEQCDRHQGKANAPIWGFTRERQTLSITNTAALTFEPDVAKAGVILQAWTMSTMLTNKHGPHSKFVLSHEHQLGVQAVWGHSKMLELLPPIASLLWPLHNSVLFWAFWARCQNGLQDVHRKPWHPLHESPSTEHGEERIYCATGVRRHLWPIARGKCIQMHMHTHTLKLFNYWK